jgi:hypothetical protein
MKICPECKKTYTDDGLNFCLEDGAVLTQAGGRESLPETVLINQPRRTSPNPNLVNPTGAQPSWNNQPQPAPAKKSSKAWLWAIGILGLAVLLCGGGFIGFLGWVATLDTNTNTVENTRDNSNRKVAENTNSSQKNLKDDDRTNVEAISLEGWAGKFTEYGTTEYKDDELIIGSKQKGFYYVLVAKDDYKTDQATTRVSVRNIQDANTNLGFGLIVHSHPTPLTQDYAFLIDSVRKRYRVVRHTPQKETPLVNWTNSQAIKGGTEKNILEVRDYAGKMDFYINGELITSVKNNEAYKGGVPGIYSGDAVQVAFSDLEIRK